MKNFFKKNILYLSLLVFGNSTILGYNFTFSNVTERFLVVCYKLEALAKEYYQIIPPDQSLSHYFPNAHCFGQSILWAELKETDAFGRDLPFHGGMDLIDPETGMIEGEMQQLFKKNLANKYAFIPMQIKVVDNETFQMTVDAAVELTQGIDSLSCQTVKTVAQFMSPVPPITPTSPQSVVKTPSSKPIISSCRFGLGQIAKGGGELAGVTLCRDLHFVLLDTGEIGSPAPTKPGAIVSRIKKPILIAEINQGG